MKVLHLYANHKWTGPAELALQQVNALNTGGHCDAVLALAGHHDQDRPHAVAERCRELRIPLREGLRLRRHFHLPDLLADSRRLARWLDEDRIDLLHCHQGGDHLVASLALRLARRRVPLVRGFWDNAPPGHGPRPWLAFGNTDRVLAPFDGLAGALRKRFPRLERRIHLQPPVVPPVPAPRASAVHRARGALRTELSLGPESMLVGMTARIQPHRRWHLAWDTVARLAHRRPNQHFCVLGRPDEGVFDSLCRRPLAERGITHRVHFLGYRRGDAYYDALRAFDAFLFLVPGSDVTCRALREAMAMGIPAVATDLGCLKEIISHDCTGLISPPEASSLAASLESLLNDVGQRERLGRAARDHAALQWAPSRAAESLAVHYRDLLQPNGERQGGKRD